MSKVQTGLRLDEVLYGKLKTLSENENRSINNFVETLVRKHIEGYETAHGAIQIYQDE